MRQNEENVVIVLLYCCVLSEIAIAFLFMFQNQNFFGSHVDNIKVTYNTIMVYFVHFLEKKLKNSLLKETETLMEDYH